ncbi:9102_t:CDS:10 [Funneliformis caledonium]|uniref:9102_t:CDS:1 n=1 Tax=Funneliformis caledonium TaxID=1117310 RepID=A0A9N9HRG2_9GLOM|nr:9102_t:CDS:10 [Funneliformis caledonium]
MALPNDYLQTTSPINWNLDDFANWIATNHSDDKKKIIYYMKTGLKKYSENDSDINVMRKADDLLNSLKTLKDKKKIAELQSEQEMRLADIECLAVRQMQNHTNAASVIKLNSNNRKEIEEAYTKMKKRCMWRLSSGRYVEEELYNLGKSFEYEHTVHSFIMDVDDNEVKTHFSEDELHEIKSASRPVVTPISDEVVDYLEQINEKSSLREVRDFINQCDERLGKSYDRSKNHDIDYIRYSVYSMVRELESGSLRQENLESWYNCHVWTPIVDQGFSDINGTSVVRGESTSIATSNRKNIGKKPSDRKKLGRRGDWILRSVGNKDNDEFGAGEAGRKFIDEYDTKILTESKLKLPKMLKDMIVKLLSRVNWNIDKRKQIQTVGIVHSGLSMMILYLDNPCGYVCRLNRGEILEVPDDERFFSSVLLLLAAVLNLKSCVRETIKAVQNKEINKSSFKKAGFLKRSHDDAIEITHCTSTPKKPKSSRN